MTPSLAEDSMEVWFLEQRSQPQTLLMVKISGFKFSGFPLNCSRLKGLTTEDITRESWVKVCMGSHSGNTAGHHGAPLGIIPFHV